MTQTPDAQSPGFVQIVSKHPPQTPPQSSPASLPFLTPSVHDGGWQIPPWQTLLVQSTFFVQRQPKSHAGHGPPQSLPVSKPFCLPSLQRGAAHTPPSQICDQHWSSAVHSNS